MVFTIAYWTYVVSALVFGWVVHGVIRTFFDLQEAKDGIARILKKNGRESRLSIECQYDLNTIESLLECQKDEIEELEKTCGKQQTEIEELNVKINIQKMMIQNTINQETFINKRLEKIHNVLFESGITKEEFDPNKVADTVKEFVSNQFEMSKQIKEILELYSLTE